MAVKPKKHSFLSAFAVWTGLEPATPCVTGRYSNQLNYHSKTCYKNWWVLTGSNRRHSPCKGDALPTELSTHAHSLVRRLFYNIVLTNARFTLMCNGFCDSAGVFMGHRNGFLVLCGNIFWHFSQSKL